MAPPFSRSEAIRLRDSGAEADNLVQIGANRRESAPQIQKKPAFAGHLVSLRELVAGAGFVMSLRDDVSVNCSKRANRDPIPASRQHSHTYSIAVYRLSIYDTEMGIVSFKCKDTAALHARFRVKRFVHIEPIARRKLAQLDAAADLEFMRIPPGNRLEALRGDRKGQHSIRINQQWRLCFIWTIHGPSDVEIVDYH